MIFLMILTRGHLWTATILRTGSMKNLEPEDGFEEGPKSTDEPEGTELQEDSFSAREAYMFGVAMGWAYEEGLEEAERRKLEKKMQDDKERKEDSNA
jgi:hypothetical protein